MADEVKAAEVKAAGDSNLFPMEEYDPAPEVYIDGMAAMTVAAGVAKINCFSIYVDHEGNNKRRIVLRLALPLSLMSGIQTYLGQTVDQLKKAGAIMEIPNVRQ